MKLWVVESKAFFVLAVYLIVAGKKDATRNNTCTYIIYNET